MMNLDYKIKAIWLSMSKMYNQIASDHDVTQTVVSVLLIVPKEGLPATQIAPLLGMEATSMSRVFNSMEKKGLISRIPCGDDKRVVNVYLTKEGIKQRKNAKKIVEDFNDHIKHQIPQNKMSIFMEVLDLIESSTEEYKEINKLL
ncbi:MarR family transcriptional regulator [bacterium]|nr:MarR family transcriptional regulator [bacterium]